METSEAAAPAGYLVSPDTLEFEVADDGTIQGTGSFSVEVDDDGHRVAISKRDITDEQELEGARLTVLDEDGDVVEQWVSTTEPHLIERLAPGSYTLVEELEPRTYDKASSVTFTVEETRAVQHVAMYDRPLGNLGQHRQAPGNRRPGRRGHDGKRGREEQG